MKKIPFDVFLISVKINESKFALFQSLTSNGLK